MEQELTSSSVHNWSRRVCTSRSSSCGEVTQLSPSSCLGISHAWEIVGSPKENIWSHGLKYVTWSHTGPQTWT